MESAGIKVEKTAVGDRYVLENMLANNHQLGGEQSGHIILRNHANTGDGVLTALHLMQVMVETGKSLEELAGVMKRFPQVLINVKDVDKSRLDSSKAIAESIASCESELGDNGRILVRASGTESLVRVMVEAASIEQAQEIGEKLAEIVRLELK
jgi:phosphoglucosamine mutase